ncbi:MAG: MFS transporter, partial [Thermomicrobiaceae bacterium]|nr:MFS transporter [Thermomicrobiaceae bacterium]
MLVASWLAYAASYFPRLAFSVAKLGLLRDPAAPLSRPAMGILDGLFLT